MLLFHKSHLTKPLYPGEGLCVLVWFCVRCNRGRLWSVCPCHVSHLCRCTCSLWFFPSFIAATLLRRIANPRNTTRPKELSIACYQPEFLIRYNRIALKTDFLHISKKWAVRTIFCASAHFFFLGCVTTPFYIHLILAQYTHSCWAALSLSAYSLITFLSELFTILYVVLE